MEKRRIASHIKAGIAAALPSIEQLRSMEMMAKRILRSDEDALTFLRTLSRIEYEVLYALARKNHGLTTNGIQREIAAVKLLGIAPLWANAALPDRLEMLSGQVKDRFSFEQKEGKQWSEKQIDEYLKSAGSEQLVLLARHMQVEIPNADTIERAARGLISQSLVGSRALPQNKKSKALYFVLPNVADAINKIK